MEELVVPSELCRNLVSDSEAALEAVPWLIQHMCEHIGVDDLGDLDVLDFGCGVRFTQAFLNRGLPVKHYVGVDVHQPVIDFLAAHVTDPRFEYFRVDAQNALYNPDGQPLDEITIPQIEPRRFDVICLFSVFTHLAPHDYVAMLNLLRRFVKPEGRLFFTLFINESTEGGWSFVDRFATSERSEPIPDFVDEPFFEKPLVVALYSRAHALALIEGTGWEVLDVSMPERHIQHHIVCAPGLDANS